MRQELSGVTQARVKPCHRGRGCAYEGAELRGELLQDDVDVRQGTLHYVQTATMSASEEMRRAQVF